MKIRNGFVSNSSSSSFIVVYQQATIDDIDNPDFTVIGKMLYDGIDVFKPNDEMKYHIQTICSQQSGQYYLNENSVEFVLMKFSFSENESFILHQLLERFKDDPNVGKYIMAPMAMDHYPTADLEELEDRYGDN